MELFVILIVILLNQNCFGIDSNPNDVCKLINIEYEESKFQKVACAICFNAMVDLTFKENISLKLNASTWDIMDDKGSFFYPNHTDTDGPVYQSFKNDYAENWAQCCKNAVDCCRRIIEAKKQITDSNMTCPIDWDFSNRYCWDRADVGKIIEKDCPDNHPNYILEKRSPCKRTMTRKCSNDSNIGSWGKIRSNCATLEFQRLRANYTYSTDEVNSTQCCRTEREIELSLPAFKLDTCARCYKYLPFKLITGYASFDLNYVESKGQLNTTDNIFIFADVEETAHIIDQTLGLPHLRENWRKCCKAAVECCVNTLMKNPAKPTAVGHCPRTWDGWKCFDETPASSTVTFECPDHIYNFGGQKPECQRYAEKQCLPNATWFVNRNRYIPTEYTDYTTCNRVDDLRAETHFSISMLVVSMFALIPALAIFIGYRQLRINRIKMHVHLFIALFMNCFLSAIFKGVVILPLLGENSDNNLTSENGAGCKILLILTKYFRLASYMWMLCEGYYLHNLIASAFSELKNLKQFYAIGWVFPIIPVTAYAIVRKTMGDEVCWMIELVPYNWIMDTPSLLSLVINLVFLCHISYILITKLAAVQSNEPAHFRKAVRATLIILPIFGIQNLLVLYRPKDGPCLNLSVATYTMFVVDGLQGLVIAIIYCYINTEVQNLLKRTYNRYRTARGIDQRNIRGGRLSLSTQVSGVYDQNNVMRRSSSILHLRNREQNTVAHLNVPETVLSNNTNNGIHQIPTTEL